MTAVASRTVRTAFSHFLVGCEQVDGGRHKRSSNSHLDYGNAFRGVREWLVARPPHTGAVCPHSSVTSGTSGGRVGHQQSLLICQNEDSPHIRTLPPITPL